ncbi:MAG: glycerol-3-phosphate acyltransferase [Oscillospiraceae bacterium]
MSSGIDWLNPIYGAYLCGIACMLGHVFRYFSSLRAARVQPQVGIYAVCCPLAIVLGLCAFALVLLTTKLYRSAHLQQRLRWLCFQSFFCGRGQYICCGGLSITMGIIVLKHKDNIKRLVHGEEKASRGKRMADIAVLGAGGWGMALAISATGAETALPYGRL